MDRKASLSDFKKWMADKGDLAEFFNIDREGKSEETEEMYVGMQAKPKVSRKKLLERIDTEEDPEENIQDFIESGGTIVGVDGKMFHIETDYSTFSLPRFCVKIRKQHGQ